MFLGIQKYLRDVLVALSADFGAFVIFLRHKLPERHRFTANLYIALNRVLS
jgi:hypothetical protein